MLYETQHNRRVPGGSRLSACLLVISLILLASGAYADTEVYRWVDSQGGVHFSDTPPAGNASKIVVRTPPPQPVPEAETVKVAADNQSTAPNDEQVKATQLEAAAVEKVRLENCQRARGNLLKLETSRKIYDPLPDGERHYLDDSEVEARKAEAQAYIQRWCDG